MPPTRSEPAPSNPAVVTSDDSVVDDSVVVPAALSPSRASDFMSCPLLFRFRTIDRFPEAPSAAAVRGTLVHAVLEELFDHDPALRTEEHALAQVAPAWDAMVRDDPQVAQVVEDLATWIAEAQALVGKYFALEDPTRLGSTERELRVEVPLDDGLVLRGFVDRLDISPAGDLRVVDYKTGRSPGDLFVNKALFQMRFYGLVLWRSRGVMPRQLKLMYLGNGESLVEQPDEAMLLATERKVRALWSAIVSAVESRQFTPRRSALCQWCDHQVRCPEFGGELPELPVLTIGPPTRRDVQVEDPLKEMP